MEVSVVIVLDLLWKALHYLLKLKGEGLSIVRWLDGWDIGLLFQQLLSVTLYNLPQTVAIACKVMQMACAFDRAISARFLGLLLAEHERTSFAALLAGREQPPPSPAQKKGAVFLLAQVPAQQVRAHAEANSIQLTHTYQLEGSFIYASLLAFEPAAAADVSEGARVFVSECVRLAILLVAETSLVRRAHTHLCLILNWALHDSPTAVRALARQQLNELALASLAALAAAPEVLCDGEHAASFHRAVLSEAITRTPPSAQLAAALQHTVLMLEAMMAAEPARTEDATAALAQLGQWLAPLAAAQQQQQELYEEQQQQQLAPAFGVNEGEGLSRGEQQPRAPDSNAADGGAQPQDGSA